jgi:hypothetical protein
MKGRDATSCERCKLLAVSREGAVSGRSSCREWTGTRGVSRSPFCRGGRAAGIAGTARGRSRPAIPAGPQGRGRRTGPRMSSTGTGQREASCPSRPAGHAGRLHRSGTVALCPRKPFRRGCGAWCQSPVAARGLSGAPWRAFRGVAATGIAAKGKRPSTGVLAALQAICTFQAKRPRRMGEAFRENGRPDQARLN